MTWMMRCSRSFLLLIVITASGCVSVAEYDRLLETNRSLTEQLVDLEDQLESELQNNKSLQDQLVDLQRRVEYERANRKQQEWWVIEASQTMDDIIRRMPGETIRPRDATLMFRLLLECTPPDPFDRSFDFLPFAEEEHERWIILNRLFERTRVTSEVQFTTDNPGAFVRYRYIGRSEERQTEQPTNEGVERMSIGYYYVWPQRNGQRTCSHDRIVRITRNSHEIELEEDPDE